MHIYILLLVTLKHHFREVCLQEFEEALRIGALSRAQFIIAQATVRADKHSW
ncbi:hypothetical protein [Janthinobacterium tructae]|uniref:hypothetical protein n=1 Tax=Janthinobacterium tructae TaxID=2590869 RepID=UPI00249CC221|nr:hypothetical protein [Janthinobacterium tructae]MDI3297504.1 hypothetical protein [Janthinobacterium tructae]